jgi:hypothetical protein
MTNHTVSSFYYLVPVAVNFAKVEQIPVPYSLQFLSGAGEWKKLYLGNGAYLSLPIVSLDVPTQVQTSNDLTACRPKHNSSVICLNRNY